LRYGEKTWKGDMGMTGKEAPNKRNVQKFVRYAEGAKMYSMGLSKFQELAKDAKACYKVGQLVLVNTEILDEYLETFRIVEDVLITKAEGADYCYQEGC